MRWVALLLMVGACSPSGPNASQLGLHQPPRMLHATDRGPLDSSQELDLVIGLRGAERRVDEVLALQKRGQLGLMTPAQFGDRFGARADEYARLADWLTQHGFLVLRQEPSRTSMSVRASVASIEAAFHTRLRQYSDPRGNFYAPSVEPSFLFDTSLVKGIIGLDDAVQYHPFLHGTPSPDAKAGAQGPADLRTLYNADVAPASNFLGEGETVAILSAGYLPNVKRDVDFYAKRFTLPFVSSEQYTQIFIGGPSRESMTEANTEYAENTLDISAVMGVAPKASVIHVSAATVGGLFGDAFYFAVNQIPQAHAVSVSWGGCERGSDASLQLFDGLFQQAKAQGQMWFFPTGDDGTDGCRDGDKNTVISASWPSSSIYVIAVGGTSIDKTGAEVTWNLGGGGQSEWFAKPAYQTGVGPYKDDGVRDQPDVAAMADTCAFVYNGSISSIGGTSCAAPIVAALWVMLDQAVEGGQGIRDGQEKLYTLGKNNVGFNDITKGANDGVTSGFPAQAGFDLATGWGTVNLASLITNWNKF